MLPHSSMVEQAAVNHEVVGSSRTEVDIHCWVDELVSRIASFFPYLSEPYCLVDLPNLVLLAQLEEAAVSKTLRCGFYSSILHLST